MCAPAGGERLTARSAGAGNELGGFLRSQLLEVDLAVLVDAPDADPRPESLTARHDDGPSATADGSLALRRRLQFRPSSSSLLRLARRSMAGAVTMSLLAISRGSG